MKAGQDMKRAGFLVIWLLFIILCIGGRNETEAATLVKEGTIHDSLDPMGFTDIEFKAPVSGFAVLHFDLQLVDLPTAAALHDSISVEFMPVYSLDPAKDPVYEKDLFSIDNGTTQAMLDASGYWIYSEAKLKKGTIYSYTFENKGIHTFKIKYSLKIYPTYSKDITFEKTTLNLDQDTYKKITYRRTPYNSACLFKQVRSSNSAIAEGDFADNGHVYVVAHRPGTAWLTFRLENGKSRVIKVVVKKPVRPRLRYKEMTCCRGDSFENKLYHNTTKKVTWSSTNTKVAVVDASGKVKAKGLGTCTIIAKIGKYKYKCKVTVARQTPNFWAYIDYFETKNDHVVVCFRNASNKKLVITSADAALHDNQSYSRRLRLKKTVTIKPWKSAKVIFYVSGTLADRIQQYIAAYHFRFDGKEYQGVTKVIQSEDSLFETGGKWYYTYLDRGRYMNWKNTR